MTGPTKTDVCHHISVSYSTMAYPTTVYSTFVTDKTKNEGLLSLIDATKVKHGFGSYGGNQ